MCKKRLNLILKKMVDFTKEGYRAYIDLRYPRNPEVDASEFDSSLQNAMDFLNRPEFFRGLELRSIFSMYFCGTDGKIDIGNLVLETLQEDRNSLVYSTRYIHRTTAIRLAKEIAFFLDRRGYCCEDADPLLTHVTICSKPVKRKKAHKRGYSLRSRF